MSPETTKKESRSIAPPRDVYRVYLRYSLQHPWLVTAIVMGMLIIQASNLIGPLFMRQFFNLLAEGSARADLPALIFTLALIGLFWLANWVGTRIQDTASSYLESRVRSTLLFDAFSYLIDHSYNFFVSNFAGSLTSKVGKYARSYEQLFSLIVTQLLPTLIFVLGAITVLFLQNHFLGAVLAVWCIVFVLFQVWVALIRQPYREERSEADTRVTAALADAIGNQSTITLFSGAAHEQGRFGKAVTHWRDLSWNLWRFDSWMWGGIGLFTLAIELFLMGGAIYYWHRGLLTLGDFVLIQSYLFTTLSALVGINYQIRNFYDALADAGEMVHILDLPHEIRDVPDAKPLRVSGAEVQFDGVDFYFRDTRAILEQFSLRIGGGEKIALVGPSGAGKSTLTKLLLRLYDVTGGRILIDGQNIAHVTQESLRNAISFVPQEPILFHRTLMENIRYGKQDATDEEVIAAARQAHCHEFIALLPEQYETYVGERGIRLSGGERQRVAIARAILKNAPILLLDEATSSLDSESEHLIQDALEILMRGKTVMVIAHRLSTIMKMDRIVVLEGGRIADQGTHSDLLARGGLYQRLWNIQAGGFLVDEHDIQEDALPTDAEDAEPLTLEEDKGTGMDAGERKLDPGGAHVHE